MAVVRKVSSQLKSSTPKNAPAKKDGEIKETKQEVEEKEDLNKKTSARTKKVCQFCKNKTVPLYWDAAVLRRCISDRGRISPRTRTGACAKHQRRITTEIKRARHLALLPFTVRA